MNKTKTKADEVVAELLEEKAHAPITVHEAHDLEIDRAEPQGKTFGELGELMKLAAKARAKRRTPNELRREAELIGGLFGEDACYSFPVGGKTVSGPTVHLVESLAQSYGWLWVAVTIDSEVGNRVTLGGLVVDVLSGHCVRRPFSYSIAPPKKGWDKNDEQRERWRNLQLQVAFSKATRSALEHALPRWYIKAAIHAAEMTMRTDLGNRSLEELSDALVGWFGGKGVSVEQLEEHVSNERALWVVRDVVTIRNVARSIQAGTATIFGTFGVTPDGAARVEEPSDTPEPSGADLFEQKTAEEGAEDDGPPPGEGMSLPDLARLAAESEEGKTNEQLAAIRKAVGMRDADGAPGYEHIKGYSRTIIEAYIRALGEA